MVLIHRDKPQSKQYHFVAVTACNMCGSGPRAHAVLGRRLDSRQGWRPARKVGVCTTVVRCRECGLIFANPMPVPVELGQHYDVPPENYWSVAYLGQDESSSDPLIQQYRELAGPPSDGRTPKGLDVGAGIGKMMAALSKAGFEAYGIEPSKTFFRAAVERTGVPTGRLQNASVEEAEFLPDEFDFINFGAVLEHLRDPSEALRKSIGWLRPGGLMYVEVPSSHYLLSRLMRVYYRATGSDFVINICPMSSPYHLYEFTLESFRRDGARTGYGIRHHEFFECATLTNPSLRRLFNWIMRQTSTGMQLAVWLTKGPTT